MPQEKDAVSSTLPVPEDWHGVPDVGPRLGRYELQGLLGAGGMGMVFAAHDPELDRAVAVKVLRSRDGVLDEAGTARLRREGITMARLTHPNVIRVYDVGVASGHLFVAMELVHGETLAEWLRRAARPASEVIDAFVQAGRGLAAAHQAGLVHRDFKPQNVLIGDDGRVLVTDFGLARSVDAAAPVDAPARDVDASSPLVTQPGQVVGTPAFMAPEQRDGAVVDARADQYSFCRALVDALREASPGDVPARIRAALDRGLRADPDARWPSMAALLAELQRDPRARWRRVAVPAVAMLASGLVVAALLRPAEADPCGGGRERIAAVWNGDVADRLAAAFRKTGWGGAEIAARDVGRAVDRFGARWVDGYRAACRATRVSAVQPEDLLDRRMHCLDRRLGELRATLALLVEADVELATQAPRLVGAIGDIDACADGAALADGPPPPADPEVRARIDALTEELSRAEALRVVERPHEAREIAERVAAVARQAGHVPFEVEAQLWLGNLQGFDGDGRAAQATLERALALAATIDDDALLASVLVELMDTLVTHVHEPERALALREIATALVARAGGEPTLAIRLHHALGGTYNSLGRYAEAIAARGRAVELAEQAFGPDDWWTLRMLVELVAAERMGSAHADARRHAAVALERYERRLGAEHPELYNVLVGAALAEMHGGGDLAVAERHLRRAIGLVEGALPDHPRLSEGYRALGNNLAMQGRWDDAIGALERAAALAARATPPNPMVLADIHAWLGDAFMETRGLDAARPHYERSRQHYVEAGRTDDPMLGESLALWAAAECEAGEHARAAALIADAHAILDPRQDGFRVSLQVTEAECLVTSGRAAAAVPIAEAAVAALIGDDEAGRRADARFALARALWESGKRRRGLAEAQRAVDELAGTGRERADEFRAWIAAHRARR